MHFETSLHTNASINLNAVTLTFECVVASSSTVHSKREVFESYFIGFDMAIYSSCHTSILEVNNWNHFVFFSFRNGNLHQLTLDF